MATPAAIYKRLFAGKKITVECDANGFERLRVALCKQHKTPKYLDLTTDSLCADYDTETCTGIFWIGERRKKSSTLDFTIRLEEETDTGTGTDDAKIRSDLGADQESRANSVGEGNSIDGRSNPDDHQHGATGKEPRPYSAQASRAAIVRKAGDRARSQAAMGEVQIEELRPSTLIANAKDDEE